MKIAVVFLAVISCSFALSPALQAAGSGPTPPFIELVCQKGLFGPDETTAKAIKPCADPQVYGDGPGKIHPNCGMFCQNKAFGLLDSNNSIDQAIINKWVEEKFPSQHKSLARRHFEECFQKFGSKIDLDDPTCKMAAAYSACQWSVQPKLVESKDFKNTVLDIMIVATHINCHTTLK